MSVTIEEARKAKEIVISQLTRNFNAAANSPVNGVGIGKIDEDYCVHVDLVRAPTPAESTLLPQKCEGVKVRYKVTGIPEGY